MDRLIEGAFLGEHLTGFPLQLLAIFVTQMIKLFTGSWLRILDTILINIAYFPCAEVDCFYLMGEDFVPGTGRAPDSGANVPLKSNIVMDYRASLIHSEEAKALISTRFGCLFILMKYKQNTN